MLHNYAKLLIHTGVNLRKGEYLILEAPTDAVDLVRECTKVAFERGARDVIVFYTDALNDKIRLQYAEKEEIEEVKDWQAESRNYYLKKGACSLLIKSAYPYLFEDISGDKSSAYQTFTNTLRNNIRASIRNDGTKWCIASYPNPLWAKTLYPDCEEQEALDKMFDLMCEICQIRKDKDPSLSWIEHIQSLQKRETVLDGYHIDRLVFTNGIGTNLEVGLFEGAHFSRSGKLFDENSYCANIPSYEICTSPDKFRINGTVMASKPLELGGAIVEGFGFTFKDGKVINLFAEKNETVLRNLVNTDEGSCYLGEVALVPYNSPISLSDKLFFNTLYDENASCHLALGNAFPGTVTGCNPLDYDSWDQHHLNHSSVHIDFMFGTSDMTVKGYDKNNNEYLIFENGNWAF